MEASHLPCNAERQTAKKLRKPIFLGLTLAARKRYKLKRQRNSQSLTNLLNGDGYTSSYIYS